MPKLARLKKKEFHEALAEELLTLEEFAEKIGSNQSYLSRIYSESPSGCRCGKKFIRRVLDGFDGKYRFNDIFFWVQ